MVALLGSYYATGGVAEPTATKSSPVEMKPYVETIPESDVTFKMVPIPGGKFIMGSPDSEPGRGEHEGPQIEVVVKPFWMGACEVTWNEFDIFAFKYDIKAAAELAKRGQPVKRTPLDHNADAVTRPTPPYVDMTFGYGRDRYPAICMTQHAATQYCKWLAAKTGKPYRLPTEAEWEYACRAGSKTAYFFGDDAKPLDDYAWHFKNANEKPQPVGKKKPNPWGLHDIHGNVMEWCRDKYVPDYFARIGKSGRPALNPLIVTDETLWCTARGGSWDNDPVDLRAAVRVGAEEEWSVQDPQSPKSIWWHTDAHFVGFRVVRPLEAEKEQDNVGKTQ